MLYRYLLLVRFGLLNLVVASLVASAYLQGWLKAILDAELVELSWGIAAVFLYGLIFCALRVWRTAVELNDVKAGRPAPGSLAERFLTSARNGDTQRSDRLLSALRLRLTNRIVIVRHVANALVFLGLIGTVIGFIIALSGVDSGNATDADSVGAMVSTLITGMSVALNTTLVGAVLYVWLIVNHRLLVTGTVNLLAATIDLAETAPGESHGRT